MEGPSSNLKMGPGKAGHVSTDNKATLGVHAGKIKIEFEVDLDKL